MITADQLLAHGIGDYILQSDWMAQNKTKASVPAAVHAFVYTLCLWPLTWGKSTDLRVTVILCVIGGTHFFIDRYRLARYVVWAKNWLGPNLPWKECRATGYPPSSPPWLAVWLLIIADNIMHVAINGIALKYL